jgi:hypothetical protein
MAFDKHVFISYAHLDNEPLSPGQQGWISRFHQSLEAMLGTRLGRKAQIWRDMKLNGNDIFGEEIIAQFPHTAILVSILTPRYVASDWCNKEVVSFCDAASRNGGLMLENKARIVKVIKTPVEREDPLPPVMKQMLGYPFFIVDEQQAPLELDPAYGADLAQQYNVKVVKLAWDIAQLIKKMEAAGSAPVREATPVSSKPAVYLAHCAYDRREAREAIEAELKVQGYRIVPEDRLPEEEEEFRAEVGRLLDTCKLSIHLVGSAYGASPDGPTEKSMVMLQNELAVERSRSAGLRRVIWLPAATASSNAAQQSFINSLLTDAATQFGAELITADFETMKSAVHESLVKLEEPPTSKPQTAPQGASRLIYLICDQRDVKSTLPLRKALIALGHEVERPLFEGDAAAISSANEDLLQQCDAVLVFYGAGDEAWRRSLQSDLRKAKAYRNGRPLLAQFTWLHEPSTAAKTELIDLDEACLINALNGFSEAALAPFLKALEGKG